MNLSRLKKSELTKLCSESNLSKIGTKKTLRNKLVKTGEHWDVPHLKIKKVKTPKYPRPPKQVSSTRLVSFTAWLDALQVVDPTDETLRDMFDAGLSPYEARARLG